MAVTVQDDTAEGFGPTAHGDPMGTPVVDEQVLWKGRPSLALLSRTAFHTRSVGIYFAALIAISVVTGNTNVAILCAVLGVAAVAILYGLAWLSVRTTLYILTDTRLIMRIGMAIEARINIPLKHVTSANLKPRGGNHGDIALQVGGERLLGYWLLWPHARPWRFARPEPMLRAIPDAENVARMLAEAAAKHVPIEQQLMQADGVSSRAPELLGENEIEGATA